MLWSMRQRFEPSRDEPDLVDVLSSRRLRPLLSTDDDDGEDEEDGSDPEHSAP
ncbi:MAG: hypothetical protein IID61_00780 [SAR324 cluster bacterium]|nr:hypothetical protein [SAR324 cluster bacterium]